MARGHQRDYYEVLGVTRTAAVEEIKSAYRKAALKWHAERSPENKSESEVKFRECTEAYSVLSDAQKRQIYDAYGHAGLSSAGAGQGFDNTVFQDFHDIFGDFFGFEDLFGGGGRRGRSRAQRGADLRYDMSLTFEEASAGVTTKIKLPRQEYCEACNGTGPKKRTGVQACQTCAGRGYRNAIARRRRRRARAERRAGGRFVRCARGQRASVLRTARRGLVLHDPLGHRAGDSRHGIASAGIERGRKTEDPRRHAKRRRVSHQGQGTGRSPRRRQGRFVLPRSCVDANKAHPRPPQTDRAPRRHNESGKQARGPQLLDLR